MDYQIVATLGPGSQTEAHWRGLLAAGATAFRLNTSHLSLDQLHAWLERLGAFLSARDRVLPLVLDLQGSKWRLGDFTPFHLDAGQRVELVHAAASEKPGVLPVPHPDFFQAAPVSSGEIVLDDARIRLQAETGGASTLQARVIQGGGISPNKGITFVSSAYRVESLSAKDRLILEQTGGFPSVRYALSYVKDAAEMASYRRLVAPAAHLIAKLERQPAVDEAVQVAASADELWLCRGDLGAELGMPAMAEAVHRFSRRLAELPVPVLLAGQVLAHMVAYPAPTRSEVCYLYDALKAGYHGFVLSDETAVGQHPVESCRAAAMFKDMARL